MSEGDRKNESDSEEEDPGLNELKSEMSASEEIKSILSRKRQQTLKKPVSWLGATM